MLYRGTYTQIARAAWRNSKIREQLIKLFLKEVDRECSNVLNKKNQPAEENIQKGYFKFFTQ